MRHDKVWVCPHDPFGNDSDTATYCPQAQQVVVPVYTGLPGYLERRWPEAVLARG